MAQANYHVPKDLSNRLPRLVLPVLVLSVLLCLASLFLPWQRPVGTLVIAADPADDPAIIQDVIYGLDLAPAMIMAVFTSLACCAMLFRRAVGPAHRRSNPLLPAGVLLIAASLTAAIALVYIAGAPQCEACQSSTIGAGVYISTLGGLLLSGGAAVLLYSAVFRERG